MDRAKWNGINSAFTCPVCGKRVSLAYRCAWDDWGCYYREDENHKIMLCSQPCVKQYAQEELRQRAEKLKGTTSYEIHRLRKRGMSLIDAAHAVGVRTGFSMGHFEDKNWKELAYLDATEDG